jgi:hypothetical protein
VDFAFSAFLIFIIVLPGIIIRYAYLRGTFDSSPFVISSFTDEVANSVIWAAVLNGIWIWLASLVGHPVDLRAVLLLLIGSEGENPRLIQAVDEASRNAAYELTYFLSLYAVSIILGIIAHHIVRKMGLDLRFKWLRFPHPWYYLVTGRYTDFYDNAATDSGGAERIVYLATVVVQGETSYLYRGRVVDYIFDKGGDLDRIVLQAAYRRELRQDRNNDEKHENEGGPNYYPIIGDRFILKYTEMQTINITTWDIDEEPVPSNGKV